MESFYTKEDYSTEDIQALIDNMVEESIYLDFKEARALGQSDATRKEISKDVAAFANSDGGIIVYGIKEENHKATNLSFIDGNIFTKEWIEQIITSSIQRHIPDLRIYPIRFDGQIQRTIYIVKIPKSLEAPHISKDKRFYKRFNFESVAMEEYEIRQLYGRKIKSKLVICGYSIYESESEDTDKSTFKFEASVNNEGDIYEGSYKINVYFNNYQHAALSWNPMHTNYDYTPLDNGKVKISAVCQTPVYPNETVNAIRFSFIIENSFVEEALRNMTFDIKLFYPNGTDDYSGTFDKVLAVYLQKMKEKNN